MKTAETVTPLERITNTKWLMGYQMAT